MSISSSVIAIHSEEDWNAQWETQKESPDRFMVIDFKAAWCGPCRRMAPVFKALAAKHKEAVFLQVDMDEVPGVSEEWNVSFLPTFVVLKGGTEVERLEGGGKKYVETGIARCLGA